MEQSLFSPIANSNSRYPSNDVNESVESSYLHSRNEYSSDGFESYDESGSIDRSALSPAQSLLASSSLSSVSLLDALQTPKASETPLARLSGAEKLKQLLLNLSDDSEDSDSDSDSEASQQSSIAYTSSFHSYHSQSDANEGHKSSGSDESFSSSSGSEESISLNLLMQRVRESKQVQQEESLERSDSFASDSFEDVSIASIHKPMPDISSAFVEKKIEKLRRKLNPNEDNQKPATLLGKALRELSPNETAFLTKKINSIKHSSTLPSRPQSAVQQPLVSQLSDSKENMHIEISPRIMARIRSKNLVSDIKNMPMEECQGPRMYPTADGKNPLLLRLLHNVRNTCSQPLHPKSISVPNTSSKPPVKREEAEKKVREEQLHEKQQVKRQEEAIQLLKKSQRLQREAKSKLPPSEGNEHPQSLLLERYLRAELGSDHFIQNQPPPLYELDPLYWKKMLLDRPEAWAQIKEHSQRMAAAADKILPREEKELVESQQEMWMNVMRRMADSISNQQQQQKETKAQDERRSEEVRLRMESIHTVVKKSNAQLWKAVQEMGLG